MTEKTDSHPNWYTMTPEAVGQELQVDPAKGLSAAINWQRRRKSLAGKHFYASIRISCKSSYSARP
jgi:hypothetical protein